PEALRHRPRKLVLGDLSRLEQHLLGRATGLPRLGDRGVDAVASRVAELDQVVRDEAARPAAPAGWGETVRPAVLGRTASVRAAIGALGHGAGRFADGRYAASRRHLARLADRCIDAGVDLGCDLGHARLPLDNAVRLVGVAWDRAR